MQNSDFYLDNNIMNPGVFIDIDGVLLKGGKPFEWTKEAIHSLWDNEIPFCFVTNGTYCTEVLAKNLSNILDLPLTTDHVVVAPSPCNAMTEYHDKRVLVCCQDSGIGLISELGFTNYLTIPELVDIFPELDYVDHERRKELAKMQMTQELFNAQNEFKPIEAILLLGEPIKWEQALQVIIDVLMTNGDPRSKFKFVPSPHIPVIACNKDVTFKGPAHLPRFGHGAFLECLEALYLKITKNDLIYEEITGKPYVITYEFAANKIQALSKNGRINKFYMIGDNPEVDVRGANLFREHLMMEEHKLSSRRSSARSSRRGSYANLNNVSSAEQSRWNNRVESILVCTGVYNPENDLLVYLRSLFNSSMILPKDNNNNNNMSTSSSNEDTISEETSSSSSSGLVDSNNNSYISGRCMRRNDSNVSMKAEELEELKNAMSRKNSFISYFDDKLNVPDVTVNTFKDAVDYIVKCVKANY